MLVEICFAHYEYSEMTEYILSHYQSWVKFRGTKTNTIN